MSVISILVLVLVVAVALWLLGMLPLDGKAKQIVTVVVVLLALLYLLSGIGVLPAVGTVRIGRSALGIRALGPRI